MSHMPRSTAAALRALSLLLAALVAAGCATVQPSSRGKDRPVSARPPTGPATAEALLAQTVTLIAAATPSSLAEAIRVASTADGAGVAGDASGAAAAGILADTLLWDLYPHSAPAREGTGPALAAERITSPFLSRIASALPLLEPRSVIDETGLTALRSGLVEAGAQQPSSPLPPYFLALVAERRPDGLAEARTQLDGALKRSPAFAPAAAELSRMIIRGGTAASELPLLRHLASLLSTPAERFAALARAELAAGNPAAAADAAAQGLVQAPDDPEFALLRAQALAATGDWYLSLRVLDALLQRSPGFSPAVLLKAQLLHEKAGNTPEALRVLAEAESGGLTDASYLELQARILRDENRSMEAVAALKRAHELDPQSVSVLSALASTSVEEGQWNDAESHLARIPEQSRGPEQLRLGWKISTGLGDTLRALEYAQALYRLTPTAEALVLEARSLVAAGRPPDAMSAIERALLDTALQPEQASELHFLRAQAGSADPLADLRSALLENPDNPEALAAISDVLAGQKDYRKAMEYARRAAALAPGNAALAQKAEDLAKLVPPEQQPGQ